MARKPYKTKEKRTKRELTAGMLEHLIHGCRLLDGEGNPFDTDDERKNTWLKHRNYILLHYRDREISDHDGTFQPLTFTSGSRPAAWWSFSNEYGEREAQESQFEFLKRNNLLFSDEANQFLKNQEIEKAHDLRHKTFMNNDKPDLKIL